MSGRGISVRPIFFQPCQLGQLHFWKNFPTHEVQQSVLGLVYHTCFLSCSMVAPHDYIITSSRSARDIVRKIMSHRQWHIALNYQRTSRIKCNACDIHWTPWWLAQSLANWSATRPPNLLRTLFKMPWFWLTNGNAAGWTSKQMPSVVKDTSSDTASPNIHSNKASALWQFRHGLTKGTLFDPNQLCRLWLIKWDA